MDDFGSMGVADLRGRDNYQCQLRDEYTCQDGYVAKCKFKGMAQCPASRAEMKMASSWIGVTNYAKWIAAKRFGTGMDHWQQVIFDEAHDMPNALADAMQIKLGDHEINEVLKIDFPDEMDEDSMTSWKTWASFARIEAEEQMIEVKEKIRTASQIKTLWVKHYNHMRSLVRKLSVISTAQSNNWVPDRVEDGFVFDPIRPGRYGEAILLLMMDDIIAVSATVRPQTMWMCGMSSKDFIFREYPSDFNPADCPVYYIPTMPIDSRHPDQRLVLARLDQIASARRDRKGIVHSVSHDRKDAIKQYSRYGQFMIVNKRREPIYVALDEYRQAGPGFILNSPSVGSGFDFPGDQCEWQFLYKIPFEPPSKIVRAREDDDSEYRGYKAMQSMVQAFGRGARFRGDRCENFIGDDNLKWFWPKFSHLAPEWFFKLFKRIAYVPEPLPKL